MEKNPKLFWVVLIVIAVVTIATVAWNKSQESPDAITLNEAPILAAQTLFKQRVNEGVDISDGPCLTNDLKPGWVVDVVHNPRVESDNLLENQCPAFLEGRARHFIELDLKGNVVRVK